MDVVMDSEEYEIFRSLIEGGISRDAAILHMVQKTEDFNVIEEIDDEFDEEMFEEESPETGKQNEGVQ